MAIGARLARLIQCSYLQYRDLYVVLLLSDLNDYQRRSTAHM